MTAAPATPRQAGLPARLLLVGAGKMGGALLQGWLALGLGAGSITILDPAARTEFAAFCLQRGIGLNPANVPNPDVVVLAVKPQMLDAVAPALAALVRPGTLLISVIAGKTIADLGARLPGLGTIVRAMPNTPAAVGRAITGIATSGPLTAAQKAMVDRLLTAVGHIEWLPDESLIDAVTAVSGSGPAYVFLLAEALAAAGAAAGLPPEIAARLARATVEGAGELLYRSPDISPATLRQNVTSPGGTTAAALGVLMASDGLQPLMDRAVAAARARGRELSG